MKIARFSYFCSLFLFIITAGHGVAPLFLATFIGAMYPKGELFILSWIHLSAIGVLLTSFFYTKAIVKRILENISLILGAIFYRMLVGNDLIENIPVLSQLPFLISFGVFLYFKMMAYFNKSNIPDDRNSDS